MADPRDLTTIARSNKGQRMVNVAVGANCRLVNLPGWCKFATVQFYDSSNGPATGDYSDESSDQTDGSAMVQPYQTAYDGAPVAWRITNERGTLQSAPQIAIGGRSAGDTCTIRMEG